MKREDIPKGLKAVTDTPAQIEKWIAQDNEPLVSGKIM